MSRMKNRMMEEQARGWSSLGEKYACANCFEDHALRQFVEDNAVDEECSYCGNSPATKMDDVMELINEGLNSEWANPDDELVPYESREGGYKLTEVFNVYDIFHDKLENPFANHQLRDDVIDAYRNLRWLWCQQDFIEPTPNAMLQHDWKSFVESVKHQRRYFFLVEYLDGLADLLSDQIRSLPKGTRILRGRVHSPCETLKSHSDLGAPPVNAARFANRMSPAGIPMFYGAFDKETVIAEIVEPGDGGGKLVTLGAFETAREFPVLDLTDLPAIPSVFEDQDRLRRHVLRFKSDFARDLAKPIKKDGREHIEYVPTQILTEYFRRIFRTEQNEQLLGILYSSSRRENGRCCVLFLGCEDCCEITDGWDGTPPQSSRDTRKWLGLDPDSICTIAL